MAYNRSNRLLRIRDVNQAYLEHKTDGNTTMYVYRTVIYPRFRISLSTLYNYLAVPVERMLREAASTGSAAATPQPPKGGEWGERQTKLFD